MRTIKSYPTTVLMAKLRYTFQIKKLSGIVINTANHNQCYVVAMFV